VDHGRKSGKSTPLESFPPGNRPLTEASLIFPVYVGSIDIHALVPTSPSFSGCSEGFNAGCTSVRSYGINLVFMGIVGNGILEFLSSTAKKGSSLNEGESAFSEPGVFFAAYTRTPITLEDESEGVNSKRARCLGTFQLARPIIHEMYASVSQ
jgi:hypothetical protein